MGREMNLRKKERNASGGMQTVIYFDNLHYKDCMHLHLVHYEPYVPRVDLRNAESRNNKQMNTKKRRGVKAFFLVESIGIMA